MNTIYSKRFRKARRERILHVYRELRKALKEALLTDAPSLTVLTYLTKDYHVLTNDREVGWFLSDDSSVHTAVRLLASQMGCRTSYGNEKMKSGYFCSYFSIIF